MYVCVCNAITDREIRAQAACERSTVAMIYRSLGTKPKCGKCVPLVCQMLRQVAVDLPASERTAIAAA
jgi:bacterioferritin-associated ferredoxin